MFSGNLSKVASRQTICTNRYSNTKVKKATEIVPNWKLQDELLATNYFANLVNAQ